MPEVTSGQATIVNGDGWRNVVFSWELDRQSVANNTSTIKWSLKGAEDSSGGFQYAGPFTLTINGQSQFPGSGQIHPDGQRIELRSGTVVAEGETTIQHDAYGQKEFSITASAAVYTSTVYSVTASFTLPTIARASKFSGLASSINIGSSAPLNISRSNDQFTHEVEYSFDGGSRVTISSNATTSASWDLTTTAIYDVMKTVSTSTRCTLYLRTYSSSPHSSSNLVGAEVTAVVNLTVPSYSLTTPSVTWTEANSNVQNSGLHLSGLSKPVATFTNEAAHYGAPVTYTLEVGGKRAATGTSPLTATNAISATGSVSLKIVARDTRGKEKSSSTTNWTVRDYSSPTFTKANARRLSTTSSTIRITVSGYVVSLVSGSQDKNKINTLKVEYSTNRDFSSSTTVNLYTYATPVTADGKISVTNVTYDISNASNATYYFRFTIGDNFQTTFVDSRAGVGGIIDIQAGKMGIGKYNEAGALDVGGDGYFTGAVQTGSVLVANSNTTPGIQFLKNGFTDNTGSIFLNHQSVNSQYVPNRFYLRQKSYNSSTGAISTSYENFLLPIVDADRNGSASYDILTSKNLVTIAQGGTGASSAADARTALGIGITELYNNSTGITGSAVTMTGGGNYTYLLIIGKVHVNDAQLVSMVVPTVMISRTSGSRTAFKFADASGFNAFDLYIRSSDNLLYVRKTASGTAINGEGSINYVYGIN